MKLTNLSNLTKRKEIIINLRTYNVIEMRNQYDKLAQRIAQLLTKQELRLRSKAKIKS